MRDCLSCNKPAYVSITFDNKCPIVKCNHKNYEHQHNLCEKCFRKYKNQIDFDDDKAKANLLRLKTIMNKHSAEFKKLNINS